MENNNYLISSKVSKISGELVIPGDKSISHRSLMLSALSSGENRISGLLESEDVLNTKKSLQKMGVTIFKEGNDYIVLGQGLNSLKPSTEPLDFGNSGTGCRLMMGLVATYPFPTIFTGDESLSSRPMMRVITPLAKMGADIAYAQGGCLPLTIQGTPLLAPIEYEVPVPSAQVKSAIILAALRVSGETKIIEAKKTRDHTERMLQYYGIDITTKEVNGKSEITISGGQPFAAKDIDVAADPSSAAFPVVASLIVPDSEITIRNVLTNPSRFGLFETLIEMGADIEVHNHRNLSGEKVADITARYSPNLKGITVPKDRAPSMIDEYPILSIAASVAEGETVMEGLEELKVKESDRLQAIYDGLVASNVNVKKGEDWLRIVGSEILGGSTISTHGDHRIAMSFLIAGMVSENPIKTDKPDMIATSFPGFKDLMNSIGADISFLS